MHFPQIVIYWVFSLSDTCDNVFQEYDDYVALTQDQLCPEETSLIKKTVEEKENFDKKTRAEKVKGFKDKLRDQKELGQENAIFWERVDRFLNPTQFCDINMPCTFRGQIAIKKPSNPKLEGNIYDDEILDVKKSYALPVMSGIIQTKLTNDFKTQFGDNFKNFSIDYIPIDFENKLLQLVNFNVSFYHGSVKNVVRKRKKIRYRRKKPINRKSELLNDRFKDKTDSKVIADETLEKKPDTIEPENEIKETVKNLDKNEKMNDETKAGIVKRDLRKMGNFRKLSNTDVLIPL